MMHSRPCRVVLAQEACHPGTIPVSTPAFGGVHGPRHPQRDRVLVTIASGIVACRSWITTREEHPGSGQTLLEIEEGRARFMAMAGMLTCAGFLLAILFGVPGIVFAPLW